ncbi:MAG TPA: nodulation protein NfeD [Ignavibacteria bacterium]|nr:serine protease [Bacteroidota bacterium]HRF66893.1 nodulation protein NfeD [Ignavibacteria bacterium]HRJ04616.1 nodulation protein NfeD [Ignavibacteria bacterium]
MINFLRSILILLVFSAAVYCQEGPVIYVIKIDGSINPSSADFIRKSIEEAKNKKAECLVIQLNTPGGLLKSTRYIVSDILTAPIPVIVYVSPGGAQSASAGVFITLASHIAVMAPGTNIGASHPVSGDGSKMDSTMNEKVTNDAAAFIRSISEKRKRNVKWSEDAVRNSVSITETEALRDSVIDLVAADMNELLAKVDGREVETSTGKKILNTKNFTVVNYEENWFQKFLGIISDPNIAYILMMIGMSGIMLELYNPGAILPGVVGAICILLGLYGLHTLPINYAGAGLILLAIILFIAEIKVTSYGMLTVAGVIALFIGSMMLIDTGNSPLEAAVDISMGVIITTVVIVAGLFSLLAWLVVRTYRRKAMTGESGMIGEIGEVFVDIVNGKGTVKVLGEIWKAEAEGNIARGDKVKVVEVKDLTIVVQKV